MLTIENLSKQYGPQRVLDGAELFGGLHGLGVAPGAMDRRTDEFSGGWQMRIAMAKLLPRQPDLLLMDEPTNHLDTAARHWLEGYLADYPGAVLVISHEPQFLNSVV